MLQPLVAKLRAVRLSRPGLVQAAMNAGWLYAEKALRIAVGIFVLAWLARYLGPERFGLLNYASALVLLVSGLAMMGTDKILFRELVRVPDDTPILVGSSLLLRVIASLLGIVIVAVAIALLRPDDDLARAIVAILSLGLLLQSIDVVAIKFEAQTRAKYAAIVKSIALLMAAAVKIALIVREAPLIAFAWAAVAEIALTSIGLLVADKLFNRSSCHRRWRYNTALRLMRDGWPFAMAALASAIYARLDQVMLGEILDNGAVGVYSAAVRLIESLYFVPAAILTSVLPAILRAELVSQALFRQRLAKLYELLVILGLIISTTVMIFSKHIILLMYGPGYAEAIVVLQIYTWSIIAVFLGGASTQYLVSHNHGHIAIYRTGIGAAVNILLNMMLIPTYGAAGAAVASLIAFFVATFSIVLFPSTRTHGKSLFAALVTPRFTRSAITKLINAIRSMAK